VIIKLDQKIEIGKLRLYLKWVLKNFEPNMKKDGPWGGWSITSTNGHFRDGWQSGEKIYDKSLDDKKRSELNTFFENQEFNVPTELYQGYAIELLESLKELNPKFQLSRVRIAVLCPHPEESAYWHQDSDPLSDIAQFRLHIPIETNDLCFFDYENERHHLAADGSIYILNISKMHRALNLSKVNRYHLIMNINYLK
jgi:hypothetical protein